MDAPDLVYRSRPVAKRSGKPRPRANGPAGAAAEERLGAEPAPGTALEQPTRAPRQTPLVARAQAALRAGDFRTARTLAREAATVGTESEREEARRILASLSPDPAALVAAICVLLVIVVAAALALFRAR
jgi:hypothetical protein